MRRYWIFLLFTAVMATVSMNMTALVPVEKSKQNSPLNKFPTPETLWQRYKKYKGIETEGQERIAAQDYYFDGSGRTPRYYQQIAINRSVEAIQGSKPHFADHGHRHG